MANVVEGAILIVCGSVGVAILWPRTGCFARSLGPKVAAPVIWIAWLLASGAACSHARGSRAPTVNLPPLPAAVRCAFSWRVSNTVQVGEDGREPKFRFQTREVRVAQEGDGSVDLADGRFHVTYSVPDDDVPSVSVGVKFDKQYFSSLYQLARDPAPRDQFISHGFTGLVYVTHPTKGGDYQYMCSFEPS